MTMIRFRVTLVDVIVALFLTACTHTRYVCPTSSMLAANVDSLNTAAAPLQQHTDSTVSPDSIVGVVLRLGARSPVQNANVRFRSDTMLEAYTDSAGRFALPAPAADAAVLETRRIGYLQRRDTLRSRNVRYQRLEVTLLDSYALGDMEAVAVCVPTRRP